MKLLLRSDVSGVGKKGDIVDVADGYGRNYLLPKGFAVVASGKVEEQAVSMRRARQQRDEQHRAEAGELAGRLSTLTLTIAARAKEDGELFGSVSAVEIASALNSQAETSVDRHDVVIATPIKSVGTHSVSVRLHPEVVVDLSVEITAVA